MKNRGASVLVTGKSEEWGARFARGALPGTVRQCVNMDHFPEFMKHPANRIAQSNQATPGVEGYVFDGCDGSQMAFWTCSQDASSSEHIHGYDEYMIVVQGCYTLIINGERIFVGPGEEYLIPQGVLHSGEVKAGTRTIHVFGGHRADRVPSR